MFQKSDSFCLSLGSEWKINDSSCYHYSDPFANIFAVISARTNMRDLIAVRAALLHLAARRVHYGAWPSHTFPLGQSKQFRYCIILPSVPGRPVALSCLCPKPFVAALFGRRSLTSADLLRDCHLSANIGVFIFPKSCAGIYLFS